MEIYINALMESDAFVRDRRDYSLIAVIKFPKIAWSVALFRGAFGEYPLQGAPMHI